MPTGIIPSQCPTCGTFFRWEVYPALFRPVEAGMAGERLMNEEEASCFYHPNKKAHIPCDNCGRFLCATCDIDMGGRHLCPVCLESGRKKKKLKNLERERTLWDSIALTASILPLLFCPALCVFTVPYVFYIIIRHWNTPLSVVPRTRIRFYIAGFCAILQFGLGLGVFYLYWQMMSEFL
jgi:hypothetical protein